MTATPSKATNTGNDYSSDDSIRTLPDYSKLEELSDDDKKEKGIPTDTIEQCFEYAAKIFPKRTDKFGRKEILAVSQGIDFYSGKFKNLKRSGEFYGFDLNGERY